MVMATVTVMAMTRMVMVAMVNSALTAGVATVVAGSGFTAHGTDTIVATLPILSTNELEILVEQYFALLQHDEGAVAAVNLDGS